MVNKFGTTPGTAPANKILFLSSVRPHSAKANMFCQDVAPKKSIAKSVYFFGSLDRLYLRANFAYQMRKQFLEHVLPKKTLKDCVFLSVRVCACLRVRACAEFILGC